MFGLNWIKKAVKKTLKGARNSMTLKKTRSVRKSKKGTRRQRRRQFGG
jgi:hypothetical protein